MIEITILRDLRTSNETVGWLSIGVRKWPTVERPWVPSALTPAGTKGVSCLPPGEYRLEPHSGDSFTNVWAFVNPQLDVYHWDWEVPRAKRGVARTVALIHPANWASELRGCVAPGKSRSFDQQAGRWFVERSRDAVNEIRSVIGSSADVRAIIKEV